MSLATASVVATGANLEGAPRPGAASVAALRPDPQGTQPLGAVPLPSPPGTTERASVGSSGTQGNAASGGANTFLPSAKPNQAISADGRWVAFVSAATNLTAGGANPAGGVFLRDRQTGTTTAIPWVGGGPFPVTVTAAEPSISADGSVVAFTAIIGGTSGGPTLVGTTSIPYVLVWDRKSDQTQVASLDSSGKAAPGWQPSVSADGRYIAYTSGVVSATPTPTPTPDTTAPTLSNLTSQYDCVGPAGSSVISVTVTDPDDAISSVTIGVTPPWNQLPYLDVMTYSGSNVWTYTITAGSGGSSGVVSYTVTANDSHGNSASRASSGVSPDPSYLAYSSVGCIV